MKKSINLFSNNSALKPLVALLLMIIAMMFLSDHFATSDNLFNVLRQVSVNVCISVGMTMVILTGGIDLSNLANIINIGQILTGANTLTNATASYTNDFAQGLISGSSNLVNAGNVSTVLSSLKSLANIDTSAFTQAAATKGYASTTPALSTSDKNVDATVKALTGLLGAL